MTDVHQRSKMDVSCLLLRFLDALVVFGLSFLRTSSAPKDDHLSTRVHFMAMAARLLHGPTRFLQHLFSAHDHGRLRSGQSVRTLLNVHPGVGLTVH